MEALQGKRTQENRIYDKWYAVYAELEPSCQLPARDHRILNSVNTGSRPNVYSDATGLKNS